MTDLKFNILKLLYHSYPLREQKFGNILNSAAENPILVKNALFELQSREFIENLTCSDVYKLTNSGAEVFEAIQEERDKASKQESQQRFDNKISVASVLVPSVTFILGIVFEHYTDFSSFFISIFK